MDSLARADRFLNEERPCPGQSSPDARMFMIYATRSRPSSMLSWQKSAPSCWEESLTETWFAS